MSTPFMLSLQFFRRRRVPVQFQTEAAECGLACLAMVLYYHGNRVNLSDLRQRSPISLKGVTLAQLIEMANEVELLARPLRLGVQELSKLRTPCILHWRLNHFVVLEKLRRNKATIVDPAIGRRRVDCAEISQNFSGIALELAPTSRFTRSDKVHTLHLSRFFRETRTVLGSLVQLLALSMALQVFLLLTPFYSQLVIDDIAVTGDIDLLRLAAISFIGLAIFVAVASAFRSWLIVYVSSALNLSWSSALFEHLVRLPFEYFEKRHVGDIQSRFGSLGAIRELITTQGVEALIDGMMAVTTIAVMLMYSPALTLIVVLSIVVYMIFRAASYRALKAASHEMIIRNAVLDSYFLETLRGILAIRNFGNEAGRKTGYVNRMTDTIAATANVARLNIWQDTANRLIFGVQNVVVIWIAAVTIIAGEFTVGMMVAFLAYKVHFANRAAALVDRFFQFKLVRIHLNRLEDIVDAPPEDQCDAPTARSAPARRMTGRIDIRNVSFRYGRNEPNVFTGLNLSIKPGEQVAIAGPSGSGKSTLLKIMVGLIKPKEGDVCIDERMLSDIGLQAYRRQIGVVMQNDQLLAGTMIDNITFFSSEPDLARVEIACHRAGVLDEILNMPMGLHTLVGDMGDILSGGQKQRILLARALYREPVILFLDEATSHLDANREATLVREISALKMTRVIVAHRRETLRHADRLIMLPDWRSETVVPA